MPTSKTPLTLLLLCAAAGSVFAQTTVKDAWVRSTVAQQKATGLYAQIRSAQGGTLVDGSSPLADSVEIHEMSMQGDVMRMRPLTAGLPLPAGRDVRLEPGGYHVMLMGLKKPLAAGDRVPVTLVVEGADRKRESITVQAEVRPMGSAPAAKH